MTRLALFLMWLAHFLPLAWLARLGEAFGLIFYRLGHERRNVTRTNLQRCFPDMDEAAREQLVRAHFRAFGRSFLERGILWWSGQARIERLIRIEGLEHFTAARGKPLILLAPHFVGLDMGWTRLACAYPMISMYSNQKNPHFNRALLQGRLRFGLSRLASRQEGIRPIVRAIRAGEPFYYLPDLDYGARDALFVPFFGVPAATVTALSRLAAVTGATVLPCVTRQLPGGCGYLVTFYPAWENFPGDNLEADTRRMNAFIEARVREQPEQYFWLHKRFKTRPAGEASPYNA